MAKILRIRGTGRLLEGAGPRFTHDPAKAYTFDSDADADLVKRLVELDGYQLEIKEVNDQAAAGC